MHMSTLPPAPRPTLAAATPGSAVGDLAEMALAADAGEPAADPEPVPSGLNGDDQSWIKDGLREMLKAAIVRAEIVTESQYDQLVNALNSKSP